MAEFNFLGGVLGEQSLAGAARVFEVVNIPLEEIEVNPLNCVSIEDIDDLAESIRVFGLKTNLEVVRQSEKPTPYRLISGERRLTALKKLALEDERFAFAPCVVTRLEELNIAVSNDTKERLAVMETNFSSRQLSKAELARYIDDYATAFNELKAAGAPVEGRIRDLIAARTGLSESTVARMQKLNAKLAPELKQDLAEKKLTFAAAQSAADLSGEEQLELHEKLAEQQPKTRARAAEVRPYPTTINEGDIKDITDLTQELSRFLSGFVNMDGKEYAKFERLTASVKSGLEKLLELSIKAKEKYNG